MSEGHESISFPLYADEFIGLGNGPFQTELVELGLDDDVETDEEVMANALRQAYNDCVHAQYVATREDVMSFLNNKDFDLKASNDGLNFWEESSLSSE